MFSFFFCNFLTGDDDIENVSKRANPDPDSIREDPKLTFERSKGDDDSMVDGRKKGKKKPEFETRVLEKILRESGLEPDFGRDLSRPHVLNSDQAVFQQKLSKGKTHNIRSNK
jgi:hypothetical protein